MFEVRSSCPCAAALNRRLRLLHHSIHNKRRGCERTHALFGKSRGSVPYLCGLSHTFLLPWALVAMGRSEIKYADNNSQRHFNKLTTSLSAKRHEISDMRRDNIRTVFIGHWSE